MTCRHCHADVYPATLRKLRAAYLVGDTGSPYCDPVTVTRDPRAYFTVEVHEAAS